MQDFWTTKQSLSAIPSRWELIHDLSVFQMKLVIDGFRDLVLSPISLIAGLIDLVVGAKRTGGYFHQVLLAGCRSEAWINLFGEADHIVPRAKGVSDSDSESIDAIVDRLKQLIVEQYERGDVTVSVKTAIDRLLDEIERSQEPT